jgi:hypothetical protein
MPSAAYQRTGCATCYGPRDTDGVFCADCRELWRQIAYAHDDERDTPEATAERARRIPTYTARAAAGLPLFEDRPCPADASRTVRR